MSTKHHRRCVSCRTVADRKSLWRLVRGFPSGTVQLDQGMGRSAYLCPTAECLQTAQRKNKLGRSLKASVPEEIYQALWQRIPATADRTEAGRHRKQNATQT